MDYVWHELPAPPVPAYRPIEQQQTPLPNFFHRYKIIFIFMIVVLCILLIVCIVYVVQPKTGRQPEPLVGKTFSYLTSTMQTATKHGWCPTSSCAEPNSTCCYQRLINATTWSFSCCNSKYPLCCTFENVGECCGDGMQCCGDGMQCCGTKCCIKDTQQCCLKQGINACCDKFGSNNA